MKKILLACVILLISVGSLFAFEPDQLNTITFVNNTSRDINYIYLSPGDSDFWGPEILGSERWLEPGDYLEFDIHYSTTCAEFDILCIDDRGQEFELWDVEICDGTPIEIELESYLMEDASYEFDYVDLEIRNETGYDLWYVFVSPSDSDHLGVSYLDAYTILYAGESMNILVPTSSTNIKYDVFAVDQDFDDYAFTLTIDPSEGDELYVAIESSDYVGGY